MLGYFPVSKMNEKVALGEVVELLSLIFLTMSMIWLIWVLVDWGIPHP